MLETILTFISNLSLWMISCNLVIFALLEYWRPAERYQPLSGYLLNLRITAIYLLVSYYYWSGTTALAIAKSESILHPGLIDLRIYPGSNTFKELIAGVIMVVIVDFFYYWFHRIQHTIPALWAQHKIHHLDNHINASSTNRHHWLEELFRIPVLAIPLNILFKFDPLSSGFIITILSSWGYFIHANLRLELGPLTKVVAGPQIHRIHHSRLVEHYNKNFAAFFPGWDILFGTYYHPKHNEFPPSGVINESLSSASYSTVLPFYCWINSLFIHSKSLTIYLARKLGYQSMNKN